MKLRWPRILMYHAIATLEDDPNMLCISPERFEAQMRYLKRRNLRGVAMRELCTAMKVGEAKGLVGLTFDDGYKDFLHTALPVLERFGFSATVFVVAGKLGLENDWQHNYQRPRIELLGAKELREVSDRGMEVGSHSMTHAALLDLDADVLDREVNESCRTLSEILGEEVEGFCYPYGGVDRAAIRAVQRAGYNYACSWRIRLEHNVYDLPRIPVTNRERFMRFAAKLAIYPQYTGLSGDRNASWVP